MQIKGINIDEAKVAEALSKVDQVKGFTAKDLEAALVEVGVPKGEVSMRVADRVLQRAKTAKTLVYADRKWLRPDAASPNDAS